MLSSSVVLDRACRHRACLFGRLETSSVPASSVGVPLRELGFGKNVAICLAIALVLIAAIVPALLQSSAVIAAQLRVGSTGDDILRNPDPGNQAVE